MQRSGSDKFTLLGVLGHPRTSFGKRELKKRLESPLLDVHEINTRLDLVQALKDNQTAGTGRYFLMCNLFVSWNLTHF